MSFINEHPELLKNETRVIKYEYNNYIDYPQLSVIVVLFNRDIPSNLLLTEISLTELGVLLTREVINPSNGSIKSYEMNVSIGKGFFTGMNSVEFTGVDFSKFTLQKIVVIDYDKNTGKYSVLEKRGVATPKLNSDKSDELNKIGESIISAKKKMKEDEASKVRTDEAYKAYLSLSDEMKKKLIEKITN